MISRLLGRLRKLPNASRVSKHRMARFTPNAEIHEPHSNSEMSTQIIRLKDRTDLWESSETWKLLLALTPSSRHQLSRLAPWPRETGLAGWADRTRTQKCCCKMSL